jgi:hypothetical protein
VMGAGGAAPQTTAFVPDLQKLPEGAQSGAAKQAAKKSGKAGAAVEPAEDGAKGKPAKDGAKAKPAKARTAAPKRKRRKAGESAAWLNCGASLRGMLLGRPALSAPVCAERAVRPCLCGACSSVMQGCMIAASFERHARCLRLLTGDKNLQKRKSARGAWLPSYRG